MSAAPSSARVPPSAPPDISEAELQRYVRRSLVRAAVVLLLLVGGLAVVGQVWEQELLAAVRWILDTVGLPGLCGVLFVSDSFITPFPPDALLVVVSKSGLRDQWPLIVLLFGVVSVVAGNVGWWLGGRLGSTRAPRAYLRRFGRMPHALVERYGRRAVAIGALTPVPFSVTCWAAGMLDMPWRRFWPVTLLRIPRFFLYYLLIFWI